MHSKYIDKTILACFLFSFFFNGNKSAPIDKKLLLSYFCGLLQWSGCFHYRCSILDVQKRWFMSQRESKHYWRELCSFYSYSHGSLLRYMCPNGYYPSVQSRLCLDGHWTSKTKIRKTPECKSKKEGIILCHYIMNNWWTFFYTLLQYVFIHAFILEITWSQSSCFENGEVNPYKAKYVNDTTTYSCHSDYTFRGSAVRVCKPNGKWSGRTPICGRDCE